MTDVPETQTRALSVSVGDRRDGDRGDGGGSGVDDSDDGGSFGATAVSCACRRGRLHLAPRRGGGAPARAPDLFKREAERLEAEAEAVSEGENGETRRDVSGGVSGDDSELARARTEAALASARWVGATVRVATTRDANRREEEQKEHAPREEKSRSHVAIDVPDGVIVKTRAFVGGSTSDPNASARLGRRVPRASRTATSTS